MDIKRTPKKWASQKIFFDVVVLDNKGKENTRYATFICRECKHICDWDEDSKAFRCVRCGKKLTSYGANQIIEHYERQFGILKKTIQERIKNATD